MKKLTYIQPKVEAMVLPKEALMDDLILSASGSMGNPAPARQNLAPTAQPGPKGVWL